MCDARLFGPQIAAFSAERAVQCAPMRARSTFEIAEEILIHAPPRFALLGLSMGGIVAMEIAAQAPECLAGLALLDTNPRAEIDTVKAARAPQIEGARAGKLASVMRDEMKPRYLADGPGKQSILDLCMEMALKLGPDVFESQSIALRDRPDRQETLRGLECPSLVLMGREDSLCPLDRHELMASLLRGSTLEIIDGAGHLPVLEQPDATNAALARWLEKCDG
ncbi:Pimeloyl-[acyl-carrier protein] methyl ester esterase [Pontivivens insulae]|uniref:Pimeloyl-[acyl-carrier protein] methyl ester esterase n=2 Tax=Pontivivens insulae TaxID=1639689 RepID=A0A2R8AB38_9RHOB|nr:Pimeloyl-[acyl-carrier protein] methyl ester esterase [Pontivivens insulae]